MPMSGARMGCVNVPKHAGVDRPRPFAMLARPWRLAPDEVGSTTGEPRIRQYAARLGTKPPPPHEAAQHQEIHSMSNAPKVLVKENVGESGIQTLRDAGFEVELGFDWDDAQLDQRLGEFEGILIRSATKLTADKLAHGTSLKVIGRAGVGVDNVDVPEASKRGIIVVNAPQSNVVTAAEHTVALLLAAARHIPQAHASLISGKWERSKFSGVELQGKTLGILGFGRIGQLVAERVQGFGVKVLAYDPFVGADRFREAGVQHAKTPEEIFTGPTSSPSTCRRPPRPSAS